MQCAESPHIAFFGEALSNVKRQKLGSNRDSMGRLQPNFLVLDVFDDQLILFLPMNPKDSY